MNTARTQAGSAGNLLSRKLDTLSRLAAPLLLNTQGMLLFRIKSSHEGA